MKRQFAVFDIDGTIPKSNLLQLMAHELVARGKLDIGVGQEIDILIHTYRQRNGNETFDQYTKKVVELLFSAYPKGMKIEDYDDLIKSVVRTSLLDTYVYTRELAQTLKKNNFFLIAISTSEVRAVSSFAQALGFDAWVGEFSFVEQDKKLTGEVRALQQNKTQILESIIAKFELEKKGSTAVGDSGNDIGVLEMVDSPIVFNPNQELFRAAREKGWMVVLERRDMVYGLVLENGHYVVKSVNA
jgi:HAD superfamily phosphoserine phosphatase-like hydrolase